MAGAFGMSRALLDVTLASMSHRVLGPMFHMTDYEGADRILREGVDPEYGNPYSSYGKGFYAAHDMSGAMAPFPVDEQAIIEGHVQNPRVYSLSPDAENALPHSAEERNEVLTKRLKADGYNVLSVPHRGVSVVLKPHVFVPTRIHWPTDHPDQYFTTKLT